MASTIKQFRATTKRYLAFGVFLTIPLKSIVSVGLFLGVTVAAVSSPMMVTWVRPA